MEPWRWRGEGGPSLEQPVGTACISGKTEPGGACVALCVGWYPTSSGEALSFTLDSANFLHAARISVDGQVSMSFEVEYFAEGGGGEACAAQGAWFPIARHTLLGGVAAQDVVWPDVGAHRRWRFRVTEGAPHCALIVHSLLQWHWKVRLDVPAAFEPHPDSLRARLPPSVATCLAAGDLVVGDNALMSHLYHESDLLAWGAPIPFPCFMTLWAKPESEHDFAGLVHRFKRVRPPLLVLSGTSVEQRNRLRGQLKPLLRPEFAPVVQDIDDPDEVISALWRTHTQQDSAPPPTLAEVNRRLQDIQQRLGVPPEMRRAEYAVQFRQRDPLMLLMTLEAFGGWAPNRVFAEIQGHDIFRTYAEFSYVDGVVCAEDAVWLHEPHKFYEPAPDPQLGDKRPATFIELLEQQRPYISKLLDYYIEQHMITESFRAGLESGLLSVPSWIEKREACS